MKKIVLIIIVSVLFIPNVYAIANPYNKTSSYGTNCTWYAWKMAKEKGGVTLPGWGNAKDWYKDAKADGYSVGSSPKAKSIVVWGSWTSKGHVGYVEKVSGDTIYVWDSTGPCIDEEDPEYINCIMNGVSEETDKICRQNAKKVACKYSISNPDYPITGFIYLTNTPKVTLKGSTTTTTIKTTTTKKTTTTQAVTTTITTTNTSTSKVTTTKKNKEQEKSNNYLKIIIPTCLIFLITLIIIIKKTTK